MQTKRSTGSSRRRIFNYAMFPPQDKLRAFLPEFKIPFNVVERHENYVKVQWYSSYVKQFAEEYRETLSIVPKEWILDAKGGQPIRFGSTQYPIGQPKVVFS